MITIVQPGNTEKGAKSNKQVFNNMFNSYDDYVRKKNAREYDILMPTRSRLMHILI